LEVKVMFEPSRVATKCLIEAYSQIVPIPKWEAGQACKTERVQSLFNDEKSINYRHL